MGTFAAYRGLLANRNLTRLLGGEFVSAIGDWLYIVALLVVIYGKTGDPVLLGAFGAIRTLPYILLSVPAGILADRVDRRLILLVTDLARGACMLGMAVIVLTDGPILVLMALSVLAAGFSTFFYPAIGAYLPNLVEDERQLGPANSAWASLDNLGFVVGPVLGGLLVAAGGTTFAFLINAVTFVAIAVVLWGLPPSHNVRSREADDALPSSAATPAAPAAAPTPMPAPAPARLSRIPLVGIAVIRSIDYVIAGGVGMLTVILATDILAAGEAATGYLNAAIGIGGVAGALVSGALVLRRSLAVPVIAGAAILAGGALVLGMTSELIVAMIAIILISAGHLVLEVIAATLLQRVTTDEVRGRAVGAMMTVDTTAEAAGSFLIPVLVAAVGLWYVFGAAAILMAVATVIGLVLIGGAIVRAPRPHEATIARVLRLPLFAGVAGSAFEAALERFAAVPVAAGDVVIRQGDPADRFYVIETGRFSVSQTSPDGTTAVLRELGPDDVFGELGLLAEAPRSATVTATTSGLLLALDGADFVALIGRGPTIRGRLMHRYEGQVQ